jgi:hypothetical protein
MAAEGVRLLLVHRVEDGPIVERLIRPLEEGDVATRILTLTPEGLEPSTVEAASVDANVVGFAIGPSGLLPRALEALLAARSVRPTVVIHLPGADTSLLSVWPPEAQPHDTYDLPKGDEDEHAIAELARFLHSFKDIPVGGGKPDEPQAESSAATEDPLLRMTEGARRAVAEAERLSRARADGRIHMEHLIAGLYRWSQGRTRSALKEAGIGTEHLADILQLPVLDLAPFDPAAVPPIDHRPTYSSHAEQAVANAAAAAVDADGSRMPIRARHLFFGALNVDDCTPVEALLDAMRKARIEPTLVLEDTTGPAPIEEPGPDVEPPAIDSPPPDASAAATPSAGIPVAGLRSDEATGKDLFKLEDEVEAIATVIAAHSIEPPLALGLFGDWGTGKTFFMNMLERRVKEMAAAERDAAAKREEAGETPYYCRHIVQLRFNAWHYIDQDLWASLASEIFDGLDAWITASSNPDEPIESKRARLLTEEARQRDTLDNAERVKTEARKSVEEIDESLRKLDDQYDSLARDVPKTELVKAVVRIAADQPEIREQATKAARQLDVKVDKLADDFGLDASTFKGELSKGTVEGVSAAVSQWRTVGRGWKLWLPIGIAVVVAVALLAFVLSRVDLAPAGRFVAGAISVGIGAAVALGGWLAVPVSRVLQIVMQARRESNRLIEDARAKQRGDLASARKREEERAVQAELNAAAARTEIDSLRTQLRETAPSRQMATFIKRRQASADYRSRLGVVAKARDDFEELSRLLSEQAKDRSTLAKAATEEGSPEDLFAPIDRIVLYIDDLDRCKETEVVAVLQAVHLLLAFRLFVVVVAVDPRWLVHSLRVSSRVLQDEKKKADDDATDDDLGWETTPLNYLEKIFQVPYALRPMGRPGFKALVENLTTKPTSGRTDGSAGPTALGRTAEVGTKAGRTDGNGHVPPGGGTTVGQPTSTEQTPSPLQPTTESPAQPEVDSTPIQPVPEVAATTAAPGGVGGPAATPAADHAPARPVDLNPADLDIAEIEQKFMVQLHELIGTPRATKRFVNVYRLFKASSPPSERQTLVEADRHQPILILLAVLTGYPSEATTILRALLDPQPEGSWFDLVRGLEELHTLVKLVPSDDSKTKSTEYVPVADLKGEDGRRAVRWAALLNKLVRIEQTTGPMDSALFRPWARGVARYGFESSRVLVTEEEEREPAQEPVPA